MDTKLEQLRHLRKAIVEAMYLERWHDVWFFPPYNDVKGWEGTQDIMFVGLNPSTGHFPGDTGKFLYEQLKSHDFQSAHLTDLIKLRGTGKEAGAWYNALKNRRYKDDDEHRLLDLQESYLRQELEILKPKLVVAFGIGKGRAALIRRILGQVTPVEVREIHHFAPQANVRTLREAFSKDLADVQTRYRALPHA